jgi:hypothetical protein
MIFPIIILIAFPVALLIATAILRAAINLANGRIGPTTDKVISSKDEDDWADYPLPGERANPTAAIPLPSVGRGMMMMFAVVIVNVIVGAAIQLVVGDEPARRPGRLRGPFDDTTFIARVVTLPACFLIMSGLLTAMLPTTFRRGCLVAGFYFMICAGIAAIFFVPVLILGWR